MKTQYYLALDLGVELLVFFFTIFSLKKTFPTLRPIHIIRCLVRMHILEMIMLSIAAWLVVFFFQSTYSGQDTSFKFEWLNCDNGEELESKWMGGYDWDC